MTALAGTEILSAAADRAVWLDARRAGIGASEIAAVMGISPWESPFSLFWRKTMGWQTDDNANMSAGRRLEPVIADWWADQYPDHHVDPAGLWRSNDRPWQLSTPDRITDYAGHKELLECKAAGSWDGWGEPGTNEIPVYYRAQGIWQMDTLGVSRMRFAVLCGLEFREYILRYDPADARIMRAAGQRFMDRLTSGEAPDLDGHDATVATLKRLHPSVQDVDVQVPVELAEAYRRARALRTRADAAVAGFEARIRAQLLDGRRAMCGRRLVASRSVFDTDRVDGQRLRAEFPELAAAYTKTSTTDRLNPGRATTYATT